MKESRMPLPRLSPGRRTTQPASPTLIRRSSIILALVCLAAVACGASMLTSPARAQQPKLRGPEPTTARPVAKPDASDDLFRKGQIPRLWIETAEAELRQLEKDKRTYVRCKVNEDDKKEYTGVGIHLKGGLGSFQELKDKPALTLKFDKFQPGSRFHDLHKIHLNNSVQDPTYLNELICSEICLAAGVPTPRAGHARVWLNGRDLGFYVLKEGFDRTLLRRHFRNWRGNLYDGGLLQDIDGELVKQAGAGPRNDRQDLKALLYAVREPDPNQRWQQLEQLLDLDRFLTFMAVERMMCHWDGYCLNRNNYRLYHDPATNKWYFLAHGMDQMFGDPNMGILDEPAALVAQAVFRNPAWRARYREKVEQLVPLFNPPTPLLKRIDEVRARIRPVIQAMSENAAREHDNQVKGFKERITARAQNLVEQNNAPVARPVKFDAQGVAPIAHWKPRTETQDAKLEESASGQQPRTLRIECGPSGRCIASWRVSVVLPAGRYKLEAKARAEAIAPIKDQQGSGAGLRISGGQRSNALDGSTGWQKLVHEFQVTQPMQEVELVAELRASRGKVWFDTSSLRLVKVDRG
jgi:hypothetical protein